MQPDGILLYDDNPKEIGKNVFTDPLYKPYPDLIKLAEKISKRRRGKGTYTFLDTDGKKEIKKLAIWGTVGIYGTRWKIVLIDKHL